MFQGCLQDFSRMFSGCSDGPCGPGGIWWSFQMKVWTLMTQRNSMITSYLMIPAILWSQLFYDPSYYMIPAILWSPAIRWSQAIQLSPATQWSVGSMDFDNPKAYGDTFISNGLFNNVAGSNASMKVAIFTIQTCSISCMKCQSALQSIITEVFITCKSDNEILKQSSSFEQSQLF